MILHVLRREGIDFDYLVGAQLTGFDRMVRLSDAPIIIIEGDEYLSSALDRRPKFLHYRPQIAVLTGIAWDHINVFPTEAEYIHQFERLLRSMPGGSALFYDRTDPLVTDLMATAPEQIEALGYNALPVRYEPGTDGRPRPIWQATDDQPVELGVFGAHNFKNLAAARHVCLALGVSEAAFARAIADFDGAAKRLDLLEQTDTRAVWKDFAHAPSKVRATTAAVAGLYPERPLTAALELHTFSSLNADFLPHYEGSLDAADRAIVFFNPHTLKMKKMPPLDPLTVAAAFGHPRLTVVTDPEALLEALADYGKRPENLLLMSSGHWGGIDWKNFLAER